jgi:hypothetical protein
MPSQAGRGSVGPRALRRITSRLPSPARDDQDDENEKRHEQESPPARAADRTDSVQRLDQAVVAPEGPPRIARFTRFRMSGTL